MSDDEGFAFIAVRLIYSVFVITAVCCVGLTISLSLVKSGLLIDLSSIIESVLCVELSCPDRPAGTFEIDVSGPIVFQSFFQQAAVVVIGHWIFGMFISSLASIASSIGLIDAARYGFKYPCHRDASKSAVRSGLLIGVPLSISSILGAVTMASVLPSSIMSTSVAETILRTTVLVVPSITLIEVALLKLVRF